MNRLKPGLMLIITSLQSAIWQCGFFFYQGKKKKKKERGNVCLEIGHEQLNLPSETVIKNIKKKKKPCH